MISNTEKLVNMVCKLEVMSMVNRSKESLNRMSNLERAGEYNQK